MFNLPWFHFDWCSSIIFCYGLIMSWCSWTLSTSIIWLGENNNCSLVKSCCDMILSVHYKLIMEAQFLWEIKFLYFLHNSSALSYLLQFCCLFMCVHALVFSWEKPNYFHFFYNSGGKFSLIIFALLKLDSKCRIDYNITAKERVEDVIWLGGRRKFPLKKIWDHG